MTENLDPKQNSAKLLCMFLAEELRMNAVSLGAAKEIARAYLRNKNLIDNEEHMLSLTIELAKDFPQLKKFEQKIAKYLESHNRTAAEKLVIEFVSTIMDQDPNSAMAILSDAIDAKNDLESLKAKHPKFAEFLTINQNA